MDGNKHWHIDFGSEITQTNEINSNKCFPMDANDSVLTSAFWFWI
jgi:hypothetical protein